MKFSKGVLLFIGDLCLIVLLVFGLSSANLAHFSFFAPKYENVERKVFENTQSYIHGKVQDLAKYKKEYSATNSRTERQAIQSIINQQFSQLNSDDIVDSNLRNFLIKMRGF